MNDKSVLFEIRDAIQSVFQEEKMLSHPIREIRRQGNGVRGGKSAEFLTQCHDAHEDEKSRSSTRRNGHHDDDD